MLHSRRRSLWAIRTVHKYFVRLVALFLAQFSVVRFLPIAIVTSLLTRIVPIIGGRLHRRRQLRFAALRPVFRYGKRMFPSVRGAHLYLRPMS